jgi:hypothetical protein
VAQAGVFYLLGGVLVKVALHALALVPHPHLPDHVEVIGHDDQAVGHHPPIVYQRPQVFGDDVFVLVVLHQVFPHQASRGKKLRVFGDDGAHAAFR